VAETQTLTFGHRAGHRQNMYVQGSCARGTAARCPAITPWSQKPLPRAIAADDGKSVICKLATKICCNSKAMGAALSSPAAFGIAMVALPATALLAPTNYAIFFTIALLAVGMQTSSMQAQMDKIPADRRAYYKRLLGMAIIGISAMGMSAVVTYGGVRHSLASADALTMLNGAWDGYRGIRICYMVLLTVFLTTFGFLQSSVILTANDSNDITALNNVQSLWLGSTAKGILWDLSSMWMLTLVFLVVSPAKIAANLPALLQAAKGTTGG